MKIIIERVLKSYTGGDGWGYDNVLASDGNEYIIRQLPQSAWHVGDNITDVSKELV